MMRRRLSVCATLALLLALVNGILAPVAAQSLPAVAAAAPGLTSPTFLADGAHLAPGVTLRLAALGRGDALTFVDAVTPTDNGTRAEYAHGDVTEWYLRAGEQGGGIEQGITLAAPPVGDGPLTLTIATPGAAVLVNDTGDAATLILPDRTRWQYHGLHVTDATGRVLPSRLTQAADGGIGITVEDAGAVYPVTVDPFITAQTFTEPTPAIHDGFGNALAVSADGSTLAINAYGASSFQGKVYVYTRSGNSYGAPLTLTDPGATNGDYFGYAVALNKDGTTLAVGAYATGTYQGTVYVYTKIGSSYGTPQTLADPPVAANYDFFGYAVSVSADGAIVAVGAYGKSTGQGKVYVYTKIGGGSYGTPQTLTDPAAVNYDNFGNAVALSGDGSTLAVGAYGGSGSNQGKAYVYTKSSGSYGTPQTFTDPNAATFNYFGGAVAVSTDGTVLVVGAYGAGKAYVYTKSVGGYSTPQTLSDPAAAGGDVFGYAVAVSGDGGILAVGAYGTGGGDQGKAYVYTNAPALTTDAAATPQSATVGTSFAVPLAAHVTDSFGVSLAGVSVRFVASSAGAGGSFVGGALIATVMSDVNGLAVAPAFTADNTTGNYSVSATATTTGGAATALFSLTNTPGVAAHIAPYDGNGQSAILGAAFTTPLQAQVRDSHGNPVSGATVTFTAPAGGSVPTVTFPGGVATITAITDSTGVAAVVATASGRPGTLTVAATVPGGSSPANFGLTNIAAATTLTLTGFSPPTGPITGGTVVTLTGTNLTGAGVSFGGAAGTGVSVNGGGTALTVTAPAHAAGTVDIAVTIGGATATLHGYTYLSTGSIAPQPQPGGHPPAGNIVGGGGTTPMAQPMRR